MTGHDEKPLAEHTWDDGKGDRNVPVAFEHVSISYGGGEESLTDISFSTLPGQTVGIIGSTGSGKTTLVNLIPRAYDATSGIVRLFGKDVKSLSDEEIHALTAVVPQKSQLSV